MLKETYYWVSLWIFKEKIQWKFLIFHSVAWCNYILQEVRKRTGLVKLAGLVVRKVAGLVQLYTAKG